MFRFCFALLAYSSLIAQVPSEIDKLPVKRVVLYKNGVGYFEHLGPVHNNQDVSIAFTSGQLNDVLKSLTVLDLDGGRIVGVAYGSATPRDRQLDDLRLPIGEKTSLTEFLSALRGAKLEVRSATGVITGRLLSVERKTRMGGGTTLEIDYVSLMTESGEVKTTEVSPSFSVKLLDRGLAGKVDRYLDVVGAGREPDVRRMVISTEGPGDRSLFVSYISEVPVWKATYRIVLNPKRPPLLQGWAIIDNTVGQDWDRVQLSLIAGAPQSFIQNLSQPYYSRRPVVSLPVAMLSSPQTYESTLISGGGRIAGIITDPSGAVMPGVMVRAIGADGVTISEVRSDAQGQYELQGMPEAPFTMEALAQGFRQTRIQNVIATADTAQQQNIRMQLGQNAQTVTVEASPASVNASMSAAAKRSANLGNGSGLGRGDANGNASFARTFAPSGSGGGFGGGSYRVDDARARSQAISQNQELGDLFEYKLKEPITILKNRSALVPIVQSPITVEKVSIWNERSALPRPQRALWLTNSSGLTLDGGTFSVLEDETFAGEGIFDPIHPNEKRLISYATDLALNVNARSTTDRQRSTRVRIAKGVLTLSAETQESKTYTFRNEDGTARTVIVEHPVRTGYELRSEPRPAETTPDWMRFRLTVDGKQTASIVVQEARSTESTYQLTNLRDDQIAVFVQQRSIDPAIEEVLRKVLAEQARIENIAVQATARQSDREEIFNDQERLRENMKALKGSAEEKALLVRYTRQLNDQEDRLAKLEAGIADLDAQQAKAKAALDEMILGITFDVKL